MSLVLYYAPWSSATTSVWALEELGIPHERVKMDIGAKDTQKPSFLELNPNAKVPVLVHDGTPIFEAIAILLHLGETFGAEKKLFPGPGLERAKAFQWLVWTNVSLGVAAGRFMMAAPSDRFPAEMRNEAIAKAAKEEAEHLLEILDNALEGREWLVGSTFTFADLHLMGAISWMGTVGFDTKRFANITAWHARGTQRPAFQASMKA